MKAKTSIFVGALIISVMACFLTPTAALSGTCYNYISWPTFYIGHYRVGGDTTSHKVNLHSYYSFHFDDCRKSGSAYKNHLRRNKELTRSLDTKINLDVRNCQNAMTERYNSRVNKMCH